MTIKTVTVTLPDWNQALSELTKEEKLSVFKDFGLWVSRLDTSRRRLHQALQAVEQRNEAQRILGGLTPAQRQALRVELELTS